MGWHLYILFSTGDVVSLWQKSWHWIRWAGKLVTSTALYWSRLRNVVPYSSRLGSPFVYQHVINAYGITPAEIIEVKSGCKILSLFTCIILTFMPFWFLKYNGKRSSD